LSIRLSFWLSRLLLIIVLNIFVVILFSTNVPCFKVDTGKERMNNQTINSRHPRFTIPELAQLCGIPGTCGQPLACEGKMVWVQGWIDYSNVFDQRQYPHLDQEKFFLIDSNDDQKLDVFVQCRDNKGVFDVVHAHAEVPELAVRVHGRIIGFDMPTMDQCRRGISLILTDSSGIVFDK
jgi:hypothetical protein